MIDKTELKGEYNFKLELQPEPGGGVEAPGSSGSADIATGRHESAVDLHRRAGTISLRLDARKVPVEIIVIDHAKKPSEN